MPLTVAVELPESDRAELSRWLRAPSMPAGLAQRARIVLLAADGAGTNEIVTRTGVSKPTVIAWKKRYAAEGIDYTRPHSFMPLTAAYRRRGYLSLLGCDSQDSSPEKPAALADSIDQVSSASSDN